MSDSSADYRSARPTTAPIYVFFRPPPASPPTCSSSGESTPSIKSPSTGPKRSPVSDFVFKYHDRWDTIPDYLRARVPAPPGYSPILSESGELTPLSEGLGTPFEGDGSLSPALSGSLMFQSMVVFDPFDLREDLKEALEANYSKGVITVDLIPSADHRSLIQPKGRTAPSCMWTITPRLTLRDGSPLDDVLLTEEQVESLMQRVRKDEDLLWKVNKTTSDSEEVYSYTLALSSPPTTSVYEHPWSKTSSKERVVIEKRIPLPRNYGSLDLPLGPFDGSAAEESQLGQAGSDEDEEMILWMPSTGKAKSGA